MFDTLLTKIHPISPYHGFNPQSYTMDLQGWGADDAVFEEIISRCKPSLIVEVGTWKGASAIHMAELAPESVIVCIDTWLGGLESYTGRDGIAGDALNRVFGYPSLYFQFLANVCLCGKQRQIIPLPQTSQNGAAVLQHHGIKADLIYLDASHELFDVYLDLVAYSGCMTDDAVLIGDDFSRDPIQKAVGMYLQQSSKAAFCRGNKYIIANHGFIPPEGFKKVLIG